jgi:MOSC domain-containing protein YiiM
MARVLAVNMSDTKGVVKKPIEKGYFEVDKGLAGDAHAGNWYRQVSLLAKESFDKLDKSKLKEDLCVGAFAENLTTEGIVLYELPVGTRLRTTIGSLESPGAAYITAVNATAKINANIIIFFNLTTPLQIY